MKKRKTIMISLKKNKVVLGLSGGVDSTAAALLLQEKGYEVIGLYFDVQPKGKAAGKRDVGGPLRAEIAAQQLGIPLIYKDVSSEFNRVVIENFCSEYIKGRTPNPCIVCNPAVKFKTLIQAADEEGAKYIATGHYADTYMDGESGLWYIKRACNAKKDQSYMLYRLDQNTVSRLLLPLNEIEEKERVRQLTREHGLKNADAKDSQEICFIDEASDYKEFIGKRCSTPPEGDFVDAEGNVLGRHKGILNYTIGQRKGLGIALGKPAFVTDIDGDCNRVVLGENGNLFTTQVISDSNILLGRDFGAMKAHGLTIEAKIRYAAKPSEARIDMLEDGRILTTFKEPQRAVTPGQSIVFYQEDLVIGGGFIE
ncbi:MAG: tRNA 2-thiouridine(34) synthase MnmA [Clostridiales bacterium]|nr:tRNA 2-thiouridine(34) synthase MnmA [Clostridiales bacterium]